MSTERYPFFRQRQSIAMHYRVLFLFRTFAEISSVADLQLKCRELCDDLAHDMQRHLIKV